MRSLRIPSERPTIWSASLQGKLAAQPLDSVKANQEASRFVKTLSGLVRMLEKPDTKAATRSVDAWSRPRRSAT